RHFLKHRQGAKSAKLAKREDYWGRASTSSRRAATHRRSRVSGLGPRRPWRSSKKSIQSQRPDSHGKAALAPCATPDQQKIPWRLLALLAPWRRPKKCVPTPIATGLAVPRRAPLFGQSGARAGRSVHDGREIQRFQARAAAPDLESGKDVG